MTANKCCLSIKEIKKELKFKKLQLIAMNIAFLAKFENFKTRFMDVLLIGLKAWILLLFMHSINEHFIINLSN